MPASGLSDRSDVGQEGEQYLLGPRENRGWLIVHYVMVPAHLAVLRNSCDVVSLSVEALHPSTPTTLNVSTLAVDSCHLVEINFCHGR